MARQYRIAEAAERLNFAYIAPSGRGWGWTRALSPDSLRLRAAIEEAIEVTGVDSSRVYVMGISLGGYMVRGQAHSAHTSLAAISRRFRAFT